MNKWTSTLLILSSILCLKALGAGSQVYDFSRFSVERLSNPQGGWSIVTDAALHPAGLPYVRLMTTVAPGQNSALLRSDVENIDMAQRLQILSGLLQNQPPRKIQWDNLFLLWATLLPDSEGAQVMRIRELAIILQDMDTTQAWGYATLRQKVHNFPNSTIVQELDSEIAKVRRQDPNAPRLALLSELRKLENDFWFGKPLSDEFVIGWVKIFNLQDRLPSLNLHAATTPLRRLQMLVELREKSRLMVGAQGKNIEELMKLDKPLSQDDAQVLLSYLIFDRKLSVESMRLFSQIDAQDNDAEKLRLMARTLRLEKLIGKRDSELVSRLCENLSQNIDTIQRILEFPILDIQGRFSAMKIHFERIRSNLTALRGNSDVTISEVLGEPSRLLLLSDQEVRQSLLFNAGTLVAEVAKKYRPPLPVSVNGNPSTRTEDLEVIRLPGDQVTGRAMIVRDRDSLAKAQELAADGQDIVLVKLVGFDIELPPVKLLITTDRAINRASHMALLAASSRTPHLNLNPDGAVIEALKRIDGQQLTVSQNKTGLNFADNRSSAIKLENAQEKLILRNRLDDGFAKPISIADLVEVESSLTSPQNQISGGKGRNIALLLSLATAEQRKILAVPSAVQVPYGFFMKWFEQIQIADEWRLAISQDTSNNSVRWSRIYDELEKKQKIPQTFIDDVTAAMQPATVGSGWFVRSNSIGEDGTFNAAGVNLTLPDVRTKPELAQALVEVFLAPYKPKARAWWRRMFKNPWDVRSTVLLMQTIRSTHSSVAVVASDGSRFTIDSLPGIGENVVGGSGAIAERLGITLNNGMIGDVQSMQSAFGQQLMVWDKDKIELAPMLIKGAVLTAEQQAAAAKLIHTVRDLANHLPEYAAKPLDLEIAWENGLPHLVQMREAPAEPSRQLGIFHHNGESQTHAPVDLSVVNSVNLVRGIVDELNREKSVSATLEIRMSLARTIGIATDKLAADFNSALKNSILDVFQQMADGKLHVKQGLIQLKSLTSAHEDMAQRDPRFRNLLSNKKAMAALAANLTKILPFVAVENKGEMILQALYLLPGQSNDNVWPEFLAGIISKSTPEYIKANFFACYHLARNNGTNWQFAFGSAMRSHMRALLITIRDAKTAPPVNSAFARISQLWLNGGPKFQDDAKDNLNSLLDELVSRQFASPVLENRFRMELAEYYQQIGLNLGDWGQIQKQINFLMTHQPVLKALVRMRTDFIDDVLSLEQKKATHQQSMEVPYGILQEITYQSYPRQSQYKDRAMKILASLKNIHVEMTFRQSGIISATIISDNGQLRLDDARLVLPILMNFSDIRFTKPGDIATATNNNRGIWPLQNPNAVWPEVSEIASDNNKLFLAAFFSNQQENNERSDISRLKSLFEVAKDKNWKLDVDQWARWIELYLTLGSGPAGSFLGKEIPTIISKHAPFQFSDWQIATSGATGVEGNKLISLTLRPPGAVTMKQPLFAVDFIPAGDANSGVHVSYLGVPLIRRSQSNLIQDSGWTTGTLAQLNWLTAGRLREALGAQLFEGKNRARRLKECQDFLQTTTKAPQPTKKSG